MRKLIVIQFLTLDGYISKKDGDTGFFTDYSARDLHDGLANIYDNLGALMIGKSTYEEMSEFWPNTPDKEDSVARAINTLPKYVVSENLQKVAWGKWDNATLIGKQKIKEIETLKNRNGKNIGILGSAGLIKELLPKKIIDGYILLVYPLILGDGIPLFNRTNHTCKLKLEDTQLFKNGVVQLNYRA